MFFVRNDAVIKELMDCADADKKPPGRCMVELRVNMHGAGNSKRCTSRSGNYMEQMLGRQGTFCYQIEAQNILSPLIPLPVNAVIPERSVLVLTARIDALTVFDSFAPGKFTLFCFEVWV